MTNKPFNSEFFKKKNYIFYSKHPAKAEIFEFQLFDSVFGDCILTDFDLMTIILKMQTPSVYLFAYFKNGYWIKIK